MELVYLWVEDYKNIHKQGFNFSPRFTCDYDGKELTIKENIDKDGKKQYIENFFGDNINITAIVGKNGSGKSSVLNAIVNCSEDDSIMEEKYILVYSNGEKRYYHSNFKLKTSLSEDVELSNMSQLAIYLDREDNDKLPIDMGATKLSKQSKYPWVKYNEIDISKEMIVKLLTVEIGKVDSSFELSTFMYLPNKITIELKEPRELIGRHIRFITTNRQEVEDYFMNLSDREHQLLIIEHLKGNKKDINNIMNEIQDKNNLKNNIKISKDITELYNKKELEINNLTENQKNIYLRKNGFKHLLNIDLIDKKDRNYNDLSHGEQNIFGQLLNLYFYSVNNQNNIFLFDEPEIALHPTWQKRYINEIITLLKKTNGQKHFIFTSHSPFLLSDIPKQNIIFLDKDKNGNCLVLKDGLKEKKQTFGANIHTLLSDSFFMEDGLMGEFAKGKINEIKKFYEKVNNENKKEESDFSLFKIEYEKNKIKFEQIQSIIGEAFLKTIVKNQLEEIESILFGNKSKEIAIERFIKEFGKDAISEVINNDKD